MLTSRPRWPALLFILGLALLLTALLRDLHFGNAPMQVGQAINGVAAHETGAANVVASVLLAYRGLDTLGELAILFAAATGAGLVLGIAFRNGNGEAQAKTNTEPPAGFILRKGADLMFPFLLILGAYVILHGHLTPGGGFQGGAILAAAFFVPQLARPSSPFNERTAHWVEALAGASFVLIGIAGLAGAGWFLAPLLGTGSVGELLSAGSIPLLQLAIGLKVGSELAGLMIALHGPKET